MAGSNGGLAAAIVRRRVFIVAAWLVVCVALLPAARSIESVLSVAARIDASESAVVSDQLARRFKSPFANSAVLVATGLPSPATPAGEAPVRALIGALRSVPGVTSVLSYLDGQEALLAGAPGSDGAFIIVGLADGLRPDARLEVLRGATRQLEADMTRRGRKKNEADQIRTRRERDVERLGRLQAADFDPDGHPAGSYTPRFYIAAGGLSRPLQVFATAPIHAAGGGMVSRGA